MFKCFWFKIFLGNLYYQIPGKTGKSIFENNNVGSKQKKQKNPLFYEPDDNKNVEGKTWKLNTRLFFHLCSPMI